MSGNNYYHAFRLNNMERVWLLAKIEFKLRYYENKLGLLWALFKPIMEICIYYIAFKVILQQNVPAFASYLFIGLIIWNFFLESTSGTIQILHTKKYLYEHSNMNKMEIYISVLLSNSIGFLFNFLMFIIFFNLFQAHGEFTNFYGLWIFVLFFNLFILSLGMALILSTIYIIAKDITQVWQVITSFLFFLSPIFYRLSVYMKALPYFLYLNPIAGIIVNARHVLMERQPPQYFLLLFDIFYAFGFLFVGAGLLARLGSQAAEKL